ncbi:MAG TPA: hypothetical protein VG123_16490 [Streptosporangiaceae bacterium]|nr:hypothetical protein [Streptosporangiaceae bacterium]
MITVPRASTRRRGYLPLWIMGTGCFVAIWGGWVDLGTLTGFGPVELFPGIWPAFKPNTAIVLPLTMEVYGSYALSWWVTPGITKAAKNFAMASAIGALVLGMLAQAGAHLLEAQVKAHPGWQVPWSITMVVAWVPVVVFGLGAFLRVMTREVAEAQPASPAVLPEVVHEPAPLPVQEPAGAEPGVQPEAGLGWPGDREPVRPHAVPDPPPQRQKLPLPVGEELRRAVSEMSRNEMWRTYDISKGKADELKRQLADGTLVTSEDESSENVA